MRPRRVTALLAWVLALPAFGDPPTPDAKAEAAALYAELCVGCHGMDGGGGRYGPSLTGPKTRALSDAALRGLIGRGRRNSGMPGFRRDVDLRGIALLGGHVRRLQGVPEHAIPPPDDGATGAPRAAVTRGEALFRGKGRCLECHSVFDEGGLLGPDLSDLASRLSAEEIREAVLEPSRRVTPGYGAMTIETADGRRLHGRVRRQDRVSLQMFDADELLWTTYWKRDLRAVEPSRESLMPDEAEQLLTPPELADLFAFLESLE